MKSSSGFGQKKPAEDVFLLTFYGWNGPKTQTVWSWELQWTVRMWENVSHSLFFLVFFPLNMLLAETWNIVNKPQLFNKELKVSIKKKKKTAKVFLSYANIIPNPNHPRARIHYVRLWMCVGPVWAGEQTENPPKNKKPQKISRLLRAVEAGGGCLCGHDYVSEVFTTGLFFLSYSKEDF